MSNTDRRRTPAEEGEIAARADVRRAQERAAEQTWEQIADEELDDAAEEIAGWRFDDVPVAPVPPTRPSRRSRARVAAASKAANRLHSALGYLTAALGELEEARGIARSGHLDATPEADLFRRLQATLSGSDGLSRLIRFQRDRRAETAGFSFDEEG